MATCVFCGSTDTMTGEHVLGQWLSRIGLNLTPVAHGAGRWNSLTRDFGVYPPFRQKVRDVCGACNNGWMSDLERDAQRCLTPFILDQPGVLTVADAGSTAAWVQKTALTAMLVSSEEERAAGYGLLASEYNDLSAFARQKQPFPASRFWVGRYGGSQRFGIGVTPIAVRINGVPETDVPQGYVMTIVLGHLILNGVRFTTSSLEVEVAPRQQMPQIWPPTGPAAWPSGESVDDASFLDFARGKHLRSVEAEISVRPWTPAVDLPRSDLVDGMIELPTPCGRHVLYYPHVLAYNAQVFGHVCAFHLTCECPVTYLIRTLPDGTRFNEASKRAADIEELYERLPGDKLLIRDSNGIFAYKQLFTPQQSHPRGWSSKS